jgi:hypothetical protein
MSGKVPFIPSREGAVSPVLDQQPEVIAFDTVVMPRPAVKEEQKRGTSTKHPPLYVELQWEENIGYSTNFS